MYEKYVKNFFIIFLHNFPCVYATNLEGPTIPNNLNSDTITSNCATDYFEIYIFNYSLCSVRKFVDINSYILCWNICVTIYYSFCSQALFTIFWYWKKYRRDVVWESDYQQGSKFPLTTKFSIWIKTVFGPKFCLDHISNLLISLAWFYLTITWIKQQNKNNIHGFWHNWN